MAGNIDCRIVFHGRSDTLAMISDYVSHTHPTVRMECVDMEHWNQLPRLAASIADDHLLVIVTARKGTVSYKSAQEHLPYEITQYFSGKNLLILFPDQYGGAPDEMTYAQSQHTEERSAYEMVSEWFHKKFKHNNDRQ